MLSDEVDNDTKLIDHLNDNVDKSIDEIASTIGLSRATLYRRISSLKRRGLTKRYCIKTWCIDYGVALWFLTPLDTGIDLDALLARDLLRTTIHAVNIAYAPSRLVVIKHFYKGLKELELISNVYDKELTKYFESIDNVFTSYIFIPRHYYSERKIQIEPNDLLCPDKEFDQVDMFIIDGLIKGVKKLNDISRKYRLPLSTIRYHYREHVKKLVYSVTYVLRKNPNVLLELIVSNISYLSKALYYLYSGGFIDYIEGVYIVNPGKQAITYVEAHGVYDKIMYGVEKLYNIGLVDNAKIYFIYPIYTVFNTT